jgi:hypothetical protein
MDMIEKCEIEEERSMKKTRELFTGLTGWVRKEILNDDLSRTFLPLVAVVAVVIVLGGWFAYHYELDTTQATKSSAQTSAPKTKSVVPELQSNYGAVPTSTPETATAKPETESPQTEQTVDSASAQEHDARAAEWQDVIDEDGIAHHFVDDGETLGKIAQQWYRRASLGVDIAWSNQIENPNQIVFRQEILLPLHVSDILAAPKGWPETPASPEDLAHRAELLHPNLPSASEPALIAPAVPTADPSIETAWVAQMPMNELSPVICETKLHVVQTDEKFIWDVSQKEYGIAEFFLGINLARVNHWVAFRVLTPGEDLVIPCLREIRPDLVMRIAIIGAPSEQEVDHQ